MESGVEDDDVDQPTDSSGPETVLLRSDCILPTYYPSGSLYRFPWPEDVASTLAALSTALVYVLPGLVTVCSAGNLLLAVVLRRLYPGVLSTALYVFVALVADYVVIWSRCGLEWLSTAVNWNLRETVLSSSAVVCKV